MTRLEDSSGRSGRSGQRASMQGEVEAVAGLACELELQAKCRCGGSVLLREGRKKLRVGVAKVNKAPARDGTGRSWGGEDGESPKSQTVDGDLLRCQGGPGALAWLRLLGECGWLRGRRRGWRAQPGQDLH
jgi:hypothetical protein